MEIELIGPEAYEPPPAIEKLRKEINSQWAAAAERRIEAETLRTNLLKRQMTAPDKKLPAALRTADAEIADAISCQIRAMRRYADDWRPVISQIRAEAVDAAIQAPMREIARLQRMMTELGWSLPVEGERNGTRMAILSHPVVAAARGRAESLRSYAGPTLWPDEVIEARIAQLQKELDATCRAASAAA